MSVCPQVWFLQVPMPPLMPFLLLWTWLVGASSRPGTLGRVKGGRGHRGATRAQASALDAARGGPPWSDQAGPIPVWTPTSGDGRWARQPPVRQLGEVGRWL